MASKGSGLGIALAGGSLTTLGALLSLTGIGACIGIPMMIAGLPLTIWGGVMYRQASLEGLTKSIQDGIVQGMQRKDGGTSCGKCGTMIPAGSKFCPSCGAPANPLPAKENNTSGRLPEVGGKPDEGAGRNDSQPLEQKPDLDSSEPNA